MNHKPPFSRSAVRRRGGIYFATMSATVIVTLLALTAIIVVRIQRRSTAAVASATTCRFTAQSIIDLALHKLSETPNWRTEYTSGSWVLVAGIPDNSWSYMLEDEKDGLLDNDPYDAVRLHVRAEVDGALRLYSVLLRPKVTGNLLSNGDMESGTVGWTEYGGSCQLIACDSKTHTGKWSTGLVNRESKETAMITYLSPDDITSGASYLCEMWIISEKHDPDIRVELVVTSTLSGTKTFEFIKPLHEADKFWIKISDTLKPVCDGSITSAYLKIRDKKSDMDYYVDDASIKLDADLAGLSIVTGTFRQEILDN